MPVRIEITVHEPLQELVSFGLLDTVTIFLDYIPWFYTTFIGISLGSIGRSLDHNQKAKLARIHAQSSSTASKLPCKSWIFTQS